jgi:hypothetical protein
LNCPDITKVDFPYLFENKNRHTRSSGNVSKITKQAYRRLMLFVARLYQGQMLVKKLDESVEVPPFNFESYQDLKPILRCLEDYLFEMNCVEKVVPMSLSDKSTSTLVASLTADIAYCKKTNGMVQDRINKVEATAQELAKQIKKMEGTKSEKHEEVETFSFEKEHERFKAYLDHRKRAKKEKKARKKKYKKKH